MIHAAGVSPTQASIERIVHVDLVGTAHILDAFARVIAPGGAGIVVASMAGHRESPYDRDIEDALATTPTAELLDLPFLTPEAIGTTVHAYALSKRANSLRVQTAAAAWGKRGARVNAVSPRGRHHPSRPRRTLRPPQGLPGAEPKQRPEDASNRPIRVGEKSILGTEARF